ncbi:MAG TPA: hypothetical protein DD723_04440 [Candidatus Omnitrophica bacterium]|nr:MAG: hypothetical protein A2Z81_03940 [Omnitrophica WOR_2 bacterium GWA2_45_18]OGX20362.1 MAG: hypothetical protein A2Y04_04995 [Omnitrophica WOR_2 bacterium GWC2_45_7]HBR14778.1 hypothetical protein [Candidatus Omnitrophota bacterium]
MKMNRQGQNIIEYVLLFAVVVVVLFVTLGPQGFFTQSINESLDQAITHLEAMPDEPFKKK